MFSSEAQAGNVANGSTLYNTTFACSGCHLAPPVTPQLNAANAANSNVLNYAIANNFGGWMGTYKSTTVDASDGAQPLTATQRADITAYFDSLITAPSVSVAYHGTTADVPLKLTHDGGGISVYTAIAYSSIVGGTVATGTDVVGTSAMGNATAEYTAAYTHTANNCNAGSFIATATGNGLTSSARTVNVTVTPPAAPNVSSTSPTTVAFNTATPIAISNSGGPIASITTITSPATGSLSAITTSSISYTSNSSTYTATDSYTYRADGPCGSNSSNVTVNINVTAPTPTTPNVTTSANYNSGGASATAISLAGPIANAITGISVTTPPSHGTYTISGTTVNYTPAVGNLTTDTFQYSSTGPGGSSVGTGTVTINIVAPGAPTVTQPINVSVPYNAGGAAATTIPLAGYITGSVSGISITSAPALGTATVNGTTSVDYTPASGNLTATSFQFTATAPGGATSSVSTVSISITPPGPPTVQNVSSSTPFNTSKIISLAGSISGPYSSITVGTFSAGGSATVSGSNVTYTPLTGFSGTETFNYTAIAPGGANSTGTITMTVIPLPVVGNLSVSVPYNTATAITLPVTGFTQVNVTAAPSHGTAPTPAASSTSITYTPTTGYTGGDSFTYTATGPGGTSAAATVTITVSTLIPTAGSATLTAPLNTATTLDLAPFITGSSISGVSIATQGAHGATTVNGTVVTYTPVHNYFGSDSFSYLAYGNGGTSPTPGIVTVTVSGRPDPTQDAVVTGLIHAQIDTAKRFTHAQVVNFTGRLESLHHSRTRNTDVASLAPAARVAPTRPVATEEATSDDRNTQKSDLLQPSINRSNDAAQSQPNASADQSTVFVSSDPMGSDSPTTNSTPKSKQSALVGKTPTSAVTAIQNSSLNASQGINKPDAAKRLMGDGVRFGVRDLANQTTQQANPVAVLATALSAASSGSSQSATIGKSLTTAMSTIQSSSLNLTSSTGTDDGTSALPGGFDYWIGGGVRFGTRDQTSSSNGLDFTTDGISIGVDKRINDQFAVGMGVGFGRDKTMIGTDGTNSKAHSATIAAYGSYQPTDGTFIDGVLGYGSLRYTNDRYVQPMNDFAHAERSGDHVFTSLTSGYEFRMQGLHLSPYGRLDLAVDRLQQSTETGAGSFALTYNSQSIQSTAFTLGLRAETAHTMDFGWAMPRMRIEFQHDFKGEPQTSVSYADQPGTPYAITSTTTNQNSILFGLGSDFLLHNGLRLSFDYQMQRSSMHDNSQAVLFKLTKEIDGKAPPPLLLATSGFSLKDWKIRGDAGYTFDDNINRSSTSAERMSDSSYNAELTKSWLVPVTDHTRLVIGSALGGEKFHTYTGLDRMYLSSQVEYQYRASGDFGSPIWGMFANITGEAYSSALRDGYRYSGGVSVRKPVTDRINLFSALAHNERHGRSGVFQTRDNSFKFNLDYATTDTNTLYLNTEYRRGDLISSGSHSLQNIDIAKVFTLDDVYTRNDFYAYRFDGSTALLTLGYNLPFGPKDSIDISWQRVRSAASKSPSVATWAAKHYFDNQLSVVYLFSF